MDRTVSLAGDQNIGVFVRAFEDIAFVPTSAPDEFTEIIRDALDVDPVKIDIHQSSIIGSLLCGNSHGLVVTSLIQDHELDILCEYRDVLLLEGGMNAAGNIILANDFCAAVHPEMEKEAIEEISAFLHVPVTPLTLGGVKTVGMAGVSTNCGIIVSPRATPHEISAIEKLSDLPVGKGSINMGVSMVGTGLIANSKGYVAGRATSGYELGRIEDILRSE
ncbi:MAG: translation initiation factor IF-6 [Methanomicrobiales archaeon]|jgi:translation initiation factor 6|nr:translation initiation factor IF-6 [Methanomicrobiales archaeon]